MMQIFKKYALNTLGVIDENISFFEMLPQEANQEIELITWI